MQPLPSVRREQASRGVNQNLHEECRRLFVGGDGGLASASVLTSLCVSAKWHGVNPWACPGDVLTQLSAKPAAATNLLPDAWGKT